jgi:hypothetical protein
MSRLVVPVLASLVAGCGLASFDVEEQIPEQVVQGSPLGALLPLSLFQVPLRIDFAQQTKARGTGPASSAHLKSIVLSITSPAGQTFEFVDTIVIKISAEGLPEREVARLPARQSTPRIDLEIVPGVDVLPYAEKGSLMTASATGRMPRQDTRFDGKVVVTVKI